MNTRLLRTLTLLAALATAPAFGQKRTEQAVLIDVRNVFLQQPVFHGMAIEPSLKNGVVTLSGTVSSEAARELASDKVGEIVGVRTVLNNLVVAEPGSRTAASPAPAPAAPSAAASADQVKVTTFSFTPQGELVTIYMENNGTQGPLEGRSFDVKAMSEWQIAQRDSGAKALQ